jgi:L-alanine-DL-glutamate epimerase-like enolase superfamily enzyme
LAVIERFARHLAVQLSGWERRGHALELGVALLDEDLPRWLTEFNRQESHPLPYLASLMVASAFDIAWHDGQGKALGCDTYATYRPEFLPRTLEDFFPPSAATEPEFFRRRVSDFLVAKPSPAIPVWHLVGALDPLTTQQLPEDSPQDGYPVLLADWIQRDGLECLKIKLRGNDLDWDYQRLVEVASVALPLGVRLLSADFNCTVQDPRYVSEVLDRLEREQPSIWAALAYIEQPFAYDLAAARWDVRSIAARKPLYLDESAHDWRHVRLGWELGWNGVALKTCKTQTGALLSLCWARFHGLGIMVQDLTNPMLAQIPHVRLAAEAGTLWGVESNAMQYYPAASAAEARIHPGLYQRRAGHLQLDSLCDAAGRILGFGYREQEIDRTLPTPFFDSTL